MSKLLSSDTSYRDWIQEVSKRFRQSQIRAAVKVNDEMLRFYWSLGKDISRMSENAVYGTGFYKAISADLQDIFPDVHSFSVTNLKYMRYFYEMYPIPENRQQVVDDSGEVAIRQQTVDELPEETISPHCQAKIVDFQRFFLSLAMGISTDEPQLQTFSH